MRALTYKFLRTVLSLSLWWILTVIAILLFGFVVVPILNFVLPSFVVDPLATLASLGLIVLVGAYYWPPWPTTAGAVARTRDFPKHAGGKATTEDAAVAIETLAEIASSKPSGLERLIKPTVKYGHAQRISGAVYNGTASPEQRQEVLDAVDADAAEVVDRLLTLYDYSDRTNMKLLLIGVERFARDDPSGVKGHVEELFEVLETDYDMAVRHAALTIGHLGRELPEEVEGAAERLRPHVEGDDPPPEVLTALGELAAHDPEARQLLGEVANEEFDDPSNETVFGLLADINNHYAEVGDPESDPYPGPDVCDERERERYEREQEQKVQQAMGMLGVPDSGGNDGDSWASGAIPGEESYICENCGTVLWGLDIDATLDSYTCGNCGYELDEQGQAMGIVLGEVEEDW